MNKKLPVDPKVKDEALATYIFEQMIDNGKSLREICYEIGAKPSTISRWLRKDYEKEYLDAQEERAEYWADRIMKEADVELTGDKADNAKVQAARLKVDTAKWIASKLKPKRYGDRIQHAGDDNQPLTVNVVSYADLKSAQTGYKNEPIAVKVSDYSKQ